MCEINRTPIIYLPYFGNQAKCSFLELKDLILKGQFQGQQTRGDGGERGQEKNQKICVTMLVDIKLYVYCNSWQKEKK